MKPQRAHDITFPQGYKPKSSPENQTQGFLKGEELCLKQRQDCLHMFIPLVVFVFQGKTMD